MRKGGEQSQGFVPNARKRWQSPRSFPTPNGRDTQLPVPRPTPRLEPEPANRMERLRGGCRPPLLEAFTTEYGAPLRGTERNRSFLAAARADCPSLYLAVAVILSRRRRIGAEYGHPL